MHFVEHWHAANREKIFEKANAVYYPGKNNTWGHSFSTYAPTEGKEKAL